LRGQTFSPQDIELGSVGHIIKNAGRERYRQLALRLNGLWIERQCLLKQPKRVRVSFT
jgi:hypothetical protein